MGTRKSFPHTSTSEPPTQCLDVSAGALTVLLSRPEPLQEFIWRTRFVSAVQTTFV